MFYMWWSIFKTVVFLLLINLSQLTFILFHESQTEAKMQMLSAN